MSAFRPSDEVSRLDPHRREARWSRPPGAGPHTRSEEGALDKALEIVAARRWIVLQAVVVVVAAVSFLTARQPATYTATASLLLHDTASELLPGVAAVDPTRVAANNEELIKLPVVAQRAAALLGNVSAGTVSDAVDIATSQPSDVLRVSASSTSPYRAAAIASAYARAYVDFRRSSEISRLHAALRVLQRQLDLLSPEDRAGARGESLRERIDEVRLLTTVRAGDTELVQPATRPSAPSGPHLKRNIVLALVLGAVLGFTLAALLERFDRRIKRLEDVERLDWLPVLAQIPRSRSLRRTRWHALVGAHFTNGHPDPIPPPPPIDPPVLELFSMLRVSIRHLSGEPRSLIVASSTPQDGKSTVSYGLAVAWAAAGEDVVLVDADLHGPPTEGPEGYGLGLSTVLAGGALDDALVRLPVPDIGLGDGKLTVLPCGPLDGRRPPRLDSDAMHRTLADLQQRFEMVIIDVPALSAVSDGIVLAPVVDAAVVVVGLGNTTVNALKATREQLRIADAPTVGLVINYAAVELQAYYGH